jgi:uncharacterized protein (DUF1778 family)
VPLLTSQRPHRQAAPNGEGRLEPRAQNGRQAVQRAVHLYGQEVVAVASTARLEFRLADESKARMERAAEIAQVPLSDFVRTAAEERTDQILREHEATITVPAAFFDELLEALDAPPAANENLAAAFKRSRGLITRR